MTMPVTEIRDRATTYALLVEAKGIQRYVFDSGPLRDIVGASDLVAGLATSDEIDRIEAASDAAVLQQDLIRRVCRAVPGGEAARFSRRAGGSFCVHGETREAMRDIQALWRLAAMLRCPGLELSEVFWPELIESGPPATSEAREASARVRGLQEAYRNGSGIRENAVAELPPIGHPRTRFVPRTGRPAVAIARYMSDEGPDEVLIDAMTAPQRLHADSLKTTDRVGKRFLPEVELKADPPCRFPRNLDPSEKNRPDNPLFPFETDDTRIAVIHADLSGLGQTFQKAVSAGRTIEDLMALGSAIEEAIAGALQHAAANILLPAAKPWTELLPQKERRRWENDPRARFRLIPARPILLGGDDITLIVRADLALPFAERLLEEIEARTAALKARFPAFGAAIPDRLSACAGIAVIRSGQPFLMTHELASDLCTYAKKTAKKDREAPYPSALAFHLVGTTLQEDYEGGILSTEMTAGNLRLTANPYWVGVAPSEPATVRFGALRALAESLVDLRAGLRDMRRLAFTDQGSVNGAWGRWRDVRAGGLAAVDAALGALGIDDPGTFPRLPSGATPLFDALDLIDIGALKVWRDRAERAATS